MKQKHIYTYVQYNNLIYNSTLQIKITCSLCGRLDPTWYVPNVEEPPIPRLPPCPLHQRNRGGGGVGLALDSLRVSAYVCPSHYTVELFRLQIVHKPWSNTLLLFGTRTAALSSGSSPPGPSKGRSPMWAFRPFLKFFARF
jgi:hypothetical protein